MNKFEEKRFGNVDNGKGAGVYVLTDSLSLRVGENKLLGGGLCSASTLVVPNKSASTNPLMNLTQESISLD